MPGAAVWILVIASLVLILALLLDGAYQIATGRDAINPLRRIIRKRTPATELDCVRQGAAMMLQATALLLIEVPNGFMLITGSTRLAGVIGPPELRSSLTLGFLVLLTIAGTLFVAMVLAIAALVTTQKIKYVPLAPQPVQNLPAR